MKYLSIFLSFFIFCCNTKVIHEDKEAPVPTGITIKVNPILTDTLIYGKVFRVEYDSAIDSILFKYKGKTQSVKPADGIDVRLTRMLGIATFFPNDSLNVQMLYFDEKDSFIIFATTSGFGSRNIYVIYMDSPNNFKVQAFQPESYFVFHGYDIPSHTLITEERYGFYTKFKVEDNSVHKLKQKYVSTEIKQSYFNMYKNDSLVYCKMLRKVFKSF